MLCKTNSFAVRYERPTSVSSQRVFLLAEQVETLRKLCENEPGERTYSKVSGYKERTGKTETRYFLI